LNKQKIVKRWKTVTD